MTYIPLSNVTIQGQTQGTNPTTEIVGTNGNQSLNVCINDPRSAFNEVMIAQTFPISQIDFVYGISTLVTTSNVRSNATVTATSGLLRVSSNGSSGVSSAILSAKKFVKYRAGQGAMTRTAGAFSPPATGTQQLLGSGFAVANTTTLIDFVGFGYGNTSAPSTFSILWINNGTYTWYSQPQWNNDTLLGGTKSGFTLVPSKLNHYQIQLQNIGSILFFVENPSTGRYVLDHQIPAVNAASTPNFQNPTQQLMWFSNNASSSNTVTLYGASGGHFLEGQRNFCGPRGSIFGSPQSNLALNTETMILAVKNATYFGTTVQNIIPCRSQLHLRSLSVTATGAESFPQGPNTNYISPAPAIVNFRQVRNPNNPPVAWLPYSGANYATIIDGSNIYGQSTLSSNTSLITGITGGATGFALTVACGSTVYFDLSQYESVAYPGDVLCFMANVNTQYNTSNVSVSIGLTWNEDI
jgi:hypothetical protein